MYIYTISNIYYKQFFYTGDAELRSHAFTIYFGILITAYWFDL